MVNIPFRIRPAIILFGDSITQQGFGVDGQVGWCSLLAAAYSRRADVLNRGFSGYNTRHALELLPRVFTGPLDRVLFCTLFFGANDAALPGERQHVPIDEYKHNLQSILQGMRQHIPPEVPILLLTPPPIHEPKLMQRFNSTKPDRTNENARLYGEAAGHVAAELENVTLVDLWTRLGGHKSQEDHSEHLSDGLHLSPSGNQLVYEAIMDVLKSNFPHLLPMDENDGNGRYGSSGIPLEEKLWSELC